MNRNFYKNTNFINIFLLIFVFFCEILSSEVPRPRGVSLSRAALYPPDKDFTCFDGSKTIPFNRVNDDYCDCLDASDEPGTAACPHGIFHCTNAGHKPLNLPANRVNDGICDCCDGTDEYASETSCRNNCIELGRSAREAAQRRAELIKAGKQLRAEMSQKGILLKQEKQVKLTELQKNKDEAEKLKVEKEALKKEIEELEGTALEYYKKLEDEAKQKKAEEEAAANRAEATEAFNRYDSNQDGWLDISEMKTRTTFDKDRNGEVSDEEAKFFLNLQESVQLDAFISDCWKIIKPFAMMEATGQRIVEKKAEDEKPTEAEDMQGTEDGEEQSQEDEEQEDYEDEEEPHDQEQTEEPEPTQEPLKIQYDPETQQLVDRANNARGEFLEAERHVRDIETEITNIQSYLEKDFGTEEEFAALEGQCFNYEDHEYIYKLCPFDRTTQQPKSGAAETRLGSWGQWTGPDGNRYEQMTYDRGQSCWNGPTRSTIVRVGCGSDNKLLSVSEPNRCEYFFDFVTPAACYEAPVDVHEDLHDEL
ncbi:unnamed protein product [Psylliodes chrysocephalus]|uniref:Glucosidase 2 subunit beta n=1 Tax=Psylliodes chrysocephalus TaxID=3402493 RepID=A0A9P0G9I6_9CUCU|nr:unnamed protein product [Psylliodes chrysocephala]